VLATPGPKRLHIQMLRDIDGNELGKLFTKGMEANAPRDEFVKSINGVLKLSEIFRAASSSTAARTSRWTMCPVSAPRAAQRQAHRRDHQGASSSTRCASGWATSPPTTAEGRAAGHQARARR
jgi:hypothetical protein